MGESIERRVQAFWQASGALPRPGVTSAGLRACEQRIGRALPPDVARFYLCVNGTEETTAWLFEAWPLERVGSVPEVVTPFAGIPDYSQIAHITERRGLLCVCGLHDLVPGVCGALRAAGCRDPGSVDQRRLVRCHCAHIRCVLGSLSFRTRRCAFCNKIGDQDDSWLIGRCSRRAAVTAR
jgi:hypothetical protein